MHKYKLRYTWNTENRPEGYAPEDVENDNHGLCDAVILTSIIRPKDGSYSELIMSFDGNTGTELTDNDLFKHYCMLTAKLRDSKFLSGWKKFVVSSSFELVQKVLTKNSK